VQKCRTDLHKHKLDHSRKPSYRFGAFFETLYVGVILWAADWALHECTNNFPVWGALGSSVNSAHKRRLFSLPIFNLSLVPNHPLTNH